MGQASAAGVSSGDTVILGGLFLALAVAMTIGAARGQKRGPIRALASLIAMACSLLAAWLGGGSLGRKLFEGTRFPWILREPAGTVLLAAFVWLLVFGWLWWRGRSKNPSGEPEQPVTGAIVGCWVGIAWFSLGLTLLMSLAGLGETFSSLKTGKSPPALLRWPVRVKNALLANPGTSPLARIDLVPERTKRLLHKVLQVLNDPKAFRRLQCDEAVRAIAAHPAFYPLINDPEIKELVGRHDAVGLLSHPRVISLLEDESFRQRVAETDLESILDRALAGPAPHVPKS